MCSSVVVRNKYSTSRVSWSYSDCRIDYEYLVFICIDSDRVFSCTAKDKFNFFLDKFIRYRQACTTRI